MTTLEFTGKLVVTMDGDFGDYGLRIGGKNFLSEIEDTFGTSVPLTVMVACGGDRKLYEGHMTEVWEGSRGWSEYTPPESPEFKVGGKDIIYDLWDFEDKLIHLRVDDIDLRSREQSATLTHIVVFRERNPQERK